ncbi:MAG: hypothetical protein IKW76_03525 [Clostridia bacterium]|nr:hypothetical protein [Clostridia bacterium]
MTEKYKKIFVRIFIVTAVIWAVGFLLLDIAFPLLSYRFQDPNEPFIPGHGGGWFLFGTPLCILVVAVTYIVLRIRSRREH